MIRSVPTHRGVIHREARRAGTSFRNAIVIDDDDDDDGWAQTPIRTHQSQISTLHPTPVGAKQRIAVSTHRTPTSAHQRIPKHQTGTHRSPESCQQQRRTPVIILSDDDFASEHAKKRKIRPAGNTDHLLLAKNEHGHRRMDQRGDVKPGYPVQSAAIKHDTVVARNNAGIDADLGENNFGSGCTKSDVDHHDQNEVEHEIAVLNDQPDPDFGLGTLLWWIGDLLTLYVGAIVRRILESGMPEYTPLSQLTHVHEICIFTRLGSLFYFGFVAELPASFTLVFGCRNADRDISFTTNVLFIRAQHRALKLGSHRAIEQLASQNPLLAHVLAHHVFEFRDNDSAATQTRSFIESVEILIDFLTFDPEPNRAAHPDSTLMRTWFVSRVPTPLLQSSCGVCHQADSDVKHYTEHERDVWARLTLDQRDQVFSLASDRRQRVRYGVAAINKAALGVTASPRMAFNRRPINRIRP